MNHIVFLMVLVATVIATDFERHGYGDYQHGKHIHVVHKPIIVTKKVIVPKPIYVTKKIIVPKTVYIPKPVLVPKPIIVEKPVLVHKPVIVEKHGYGHNDYNNHYSYAAPIAAGYGLASYGHDGSYDSHADAENYGHLNNENSYGHVSNANNYGPELSNYNAHEESYGNTHGSSYSDGWSGSDLSHSNSYSDGYKKA